MLATVIEREGCELPDEFWKTVLLLHPWKTDYLMMGRLKFEDEIMYLN